MQETGTPAAVSSEAPRHAVMPIAGFQRSTSEWQLTVTATALVVGHEVVESEREPHAPLVGRPFAAGPAARGETGETAADPAFVDARERVVQLRHA